MPDVNAVFSVLATALMLVVGWSVNQIHGGMKELKSSFLAINLRLTSIEAVQQYKEKVENK